LPSKDSGVSVRSVDRGNEWEHSDPVASRRLSSSPSETLDLLSNQSEPSFRPSSDPPSSNFDGDPTLPPGYGEPELSDASLEKIVSNLGNIREVVNPEQLPIFSNFAEVTGEAQGLSGF
jgi:hypothetical protein